MGHHHGKQAWRVRVDNLAEEPFGAGVLLDDRHVLTCAHVVRNAGGAPGRTGARVSVRSVACSPEWRRTARVADGAWAQWEDDVLRGDVTLLELDEPVGCGTRTLLRRAPISGGEVRSYGFPDGRGIGIWVDAQLGGSGGHEAEWRQMTQLHPGTPWIREGCSGAGVMAHGGPFEGRVIGVVVAAYEQGSSRAAWMMPTETIESYLPQVKRFAEGTNGNHLPGLGGSWPTDVHSDPLRLALTQELTQLLSGRWAGTVLVGTGPGGATGGASWLVRLVHTADPAFRPGVSRVEFTSAPKDTVLELGTIDAAYDARGRSVTEVRRYLAGRFGIADDVPGSVSSGGTGGFVRRLLRHRPPPCLVVDGVDRAADPAALTAELLAPLAAVARGRGLRLVLGFEGRPPVRLAHEVNLDPAPLPPLPQPDQRNAGTAREAVARLDGAEREAAQLQDRQSMKFFGPPLLPPASAPRLRVRLAVARTTGSGPELAAVHAQAQTALSAVRRFTLDLQRMTDHRDDLRRRLEVYRTRAARRFRAEDPALRDLYTAASRALLTPPVDLTAAGGAVDCYRAAVERRIEDDAGEGGADDAR